MPILLYKLLANGASSNYRPFQVKINCSKFIIDGFQQQCHLTLLGSLFVTSKSLLFGVFLPRKSITILRRITLNFRQVSLKDIIL